MNGELVASFEKTYRNGPTICGELRLPAEGFHVLVLFGPSGCGKTTILRCLAGLERPEQGRIACRDELWFDGGAGICLPPQRREVGMLFQEYALFPHLTVADNIAFGVRRRPAAERSRTVAELLERFELTGLERRFPQQISGGQQQRVALARAVARRPRLLLLDEPLSALDSVLREALRGSLRRTLSEIGIPVIVVTHDRSEAMSLGDQLIVLDGGRVVQSGSVPDVFSRPSDVRVARIVGVETIVAGDIVARREGLATVEASGVRLTAVAPTDAVTRVYVCLKAEDVMLLRQTQEGISVRNQFSAVVRWLSREGPLVRVGLKSGFDLTALVTQAACDELQLGEGSTITVAIKTPAVHLIERREPISA